MGRRAKIREMESHLPMESMSATCALALATGKKVNGHQTNGDVEEAMSKAVKAQVKYDEFIRELQSLADGRIYPNLPSGLDTTDTLALDE